MSRHVRLVALTAALLAAAPLPAQQVRQQGSTAAARQAIEKVWQSVNEIARRGDAVALAALYTPDALAIDPSMPTVAGRPAIEKLFRDRFATTRFIDMTREQTSFEVYGNIALESGTYSQTWQEKGKSPTVLKARYTAIWKRVEGRWLLHRDLTIPLPPEAK